MLVQCSRPCGPRALDASKFSARALDLSYFTRKSKCALTLIHALWAHYVNVTANRNWGYSKYEKVVRVYYFSTIALRTPHTMPRQAWASRWADSRADRVDSFATTVILFCHVIFNDVLNLVKVLFITWKRQKVCLCRVWIWLLCSRIVTKYALSLQFWCLSFGFVHLTHQNLSARLLFCHISLPKVGLDTHEGIVVTEVWLTC